MNLLEIESRTFSKAFFRGSGLVEEDPLPKARLPNYNIDLT